MSLTIQMHTLTPLWTGGADGRCDRVHETGIIGGLRWWYEALVRGLGGYACDPASDEKDARCLFNAKAYGRVLEETGDRDAAVNAGLKDSVCPACYLFGCTGWQRLFRLQVIRMPRAPLHFRTTLDINKNWLGRIFQGREEQDYAIDDLQVAYGNAECQVAFRRHDVDYVQSQLAFLLRFIEAYGGLGARQQHGFGQIGNLTLPPEMIETTIESGLGILVDRLDANLLRRHGPTVTTPYDLTNFFHLAYTLPENALNRFIGLGAHFGSPKKRDETAYLPCAFDLRYKGDGNLGLRRWLRDEKGWKESDDPAQLGPLDKLMGPRSQWKAASGRYVSIKDELRTGSRVCFGMPVKNKGDYRLVIFGFAPPGLLSVGDLTELCKEYMRLVFGAEPTTQTLGEEIIAQIAGDGS